MILNCGDFRATLGTTKHLLKKVGLFLSRAGRSCLSNQKCHPGKVSRQSEPDLAAAGCLSKLS